MAFEEFPIPTRVYNPPAQSSGTATITRATQSDGWFHSPDAVAFVALSSALPDTTYGVSVEITSADDLGRVGRVDVFDKLTSGFKLRITGSTNNVQVRWTTTRI